MANNVRDRPDSLLNMCGEHGDDAMHCFVLPFHRASAYSNIDKRHRQHGSPPRKRWRSSPSVVESQKHALDVCRPDPFCCITNDVTVPMYEMSNVKIAGYWQPTNVFEVLIKLSQTLQDAFNDGRAPVMNFLGTVDIHSQNRLDRLPRTKCVQEIL